MCTNLVALLHRYLPCHTHTQIWTLGLLISHWPVGEGGRGCCISAEIAVSLTCTDLQVSPTGTDLILEFTCTNLQVSFTCTDTIGTTVDIRNTCRQNIQKYHLFTTKPNSTHIYCIKMAVHIVSEKFGMFFRLPVQRVKLTLAKDPSTVQRFPANSFPAVPVVISV